MAKESMKDLEKQVTEDRKDALPPVQVMTVGEEQDPLILVDRRMNLQLIDHEDGRLQAVAAAREGGGGLRGALQQLIDLGDRRLQAASFFLVWGCCMLTNATVMNPTANVEHKFLGFVVLTIGAWLTLLTLAGADAGRAAARAERFLRGLFF